MRILIVQDYLRCGGTERQTVSLCEQFHNSGHDVFLLTFRPGGRLVDRVMDAGIRLHALQPFDMGLDFLAPGIFREIERSEPEVILCMGQTANSLAGFLRRRFRKAVVVATARSGKAVPWLNRWSFRQADAVLANCEWWRKQLVAMGVADSKIKVIPNGLEMPAENIDRSLVRRQMRSEMDADPSTVVYLNVAMFRPRKRHEWLIETFAQMKSKQNWQLWLLGDGKLWSHCRRLVGRSSAARHIRMLGYSSDTCAYYAGADVAVSASLNDSLPNFLIEAQGAGLPVIASDFRGVGETFTDHESGFLVPADNRHAFLGHVEHLYRDGRRRETMGRAGAVFARKKFSASRRADEVLGVFEGLIGA